MEKAANCVAAQVVALMPFLTVDPASRRQRFLRGLAAFPRAMGAAAGALGLLPLPVKVRGSLAGPGQLPLPLCVNRPPAHVMVAARRAWFVRLLPRRMPCYRQPT